VWNRHSRMSDALNWQAVAYRSGGHVFLSGVTTLAEITETVKQTPIPGCKAWFLGLGSVRGGVVPMTDLSGFIFGRNSEVSEHSRLLLIKKEDETFGLLVDEILGLRKFSSNQVLSDTSDVPAPAQPYTLDTVHDGERILPVLDPRLIVESRAFLDVKRDLKAG